MATQLNYWPSEPDQTPAHYGAATLFLTYMAHHYGGFQNLKMLAQEAGDGIAGVEAYLSRYGKSFVDVFKDWVVANYLGASEGPHGYPERTVRVRDIDLMLGHGEKQDTLPQFSARYVSLRLEEGDAVARFQGNTKVAQFPARCRGGRHCWWSNRGDSIDSTLTREFDLSGLDSATLEFRAWFALEEGWDYAYVDASVDGGATWTPLKGTYTTAEDPVGNSYGDGYTGSSTGWVREQIDLSPYAGNRLLLRFEYVTDESVYLDGLVIDDVAIPELGFTDDAERDLGWQAEGFVRTDNELAQRFLVQVVEISPDGATAVREMDLDEENAGQIMLHGFGSQLERAVIIVSPVTPGTHQTAGYTLTVAPGEGRD